MHIISPDCAGIIYVTVHIIVDERFKQNCGSHAGAHFDIEAVISQDFAHHFGEHILFSESFGADDNMLFLRIHGALEEWKQSGQQKREQQGAESIGERPFAFTDCAFYQMNKLIQDYCQCCGADTSDNHGSVVLCLQTAENIIAERCGADRCRQRRCADNPDCRSANTGDNHRRRQRQFNKSHRLPRSHPGAARGLGQRRINIEYAGDRVAYHRQHAVQHQRNQRW